MGLRSRAGDSLFHMRARLRKSGMKKLAQKVANAQDAAAKEAAFSWRLGRGGKRISFAAMQPYLKLKRKTASAKAGASRYRTFKRLREKALGLIQRALPRSRKPPAQ